MLEYFRHALDKDGIEGVETAQADVLKLATLPGTWNDYDLIVSAAMLEYLPRARLVDALVELRSRLNPGGTVLLFISRDNWLMRPLIGRWWHANLYQAAELESSLRLAGFSRVAFRRFPFPYWLLSMWGHIIEASGEG